MSRATAIATGVALVAGAAAALLALASNQDWATGAHFEVALVVTAVVFVVAIGLLAGTAAVALLMGAVAFFYAPVQPPWLARIERVMELQAAAQGSHAESERDPASDETHFPEEA